LILRHQPEVINIKLTDDGWANIEELTAKANGQGFNFSFESIIDSHYFDVDFLIKLLIKTISTISKTINPSSGKIEANFSNSRKAMVESAEILLRKTGLEDADVETRVNAISQAFIEVGIELPT